MRFCIKVSTYSFACAWVVLLHSKLVYISSDVSMISSGYVTLRNTILMSGVIISFHSFHMNLTHALLRVYYSFGHMVIV
jgi:hypothetical protein